jgi:hypothetical protein
MPMSRVRSSKVINVVEPPPSAKPNRVRKGSPDLSPLRATSSNPPRAGEPFSPEIEARGADFKEDILSFLERAHELVVLPTPWALEQSSGGREQSETYAPWTAADHRPMFTPPAPSAPKSKNPEH